MVCGGLLVLAGLGLSGAAGPQGTDLASAIVPFLVLGGYGLIVLGIID